MSTRRIVRAEQAGPVNVRFKATTLDLRVIAEADREYGEIVIATEGNEGASADVVNAARLNASGGQISIEVDEAAGGITVMNTGHGGGVFIAGNNYGMVVGGVIGGMVMSGVTQGGSPVTVTAYVPAGSSVGGSSQSGGIKTSGRLAQVTFASQSGDAELDEVAGVRISSQSGDIRIALLTGTAVLNTMAGDIDVTGPASARVTARTMSGDVRGAGGLDLDASTMSGRVRNR